MAAASSSAASPAATFAFLASPLLLLRRVACLCAGYLGLDGGLKPAAPAPASSSSSAAAAISSQIDEVEAAASEDCTEVPVVLEVRSRGGSKPSINFPTKETSRSLKQSIKAERGGDHH